jgi:hypothetical protein
MKAMGIIDMGLMDKRSQTILKAQEIAIRQSFGSMIRGWEEDGMLI